MKLDTMRMLALLCTACCALATGCGGGDSATTPPPPGPVPGPPGGDPPDAVTIGDAPGSFTLPGGQAFGDLRGVAVSQRYVYVADANIVYCFNKSGGLVNALVAPETVQGIAVMPPAPDVDVPDVENYPTANFPVVLTQPVAGLGYCFVYPPNLDLQSTREDEENPDGFKNITLPLVGEPIIPPAPQAPVQCLATYDVAVDRFGSIFVTADIDIVDTPVVPDFPRALQVFNRFNDYLLENPTTVQVDPDDPTLGTFGYLCFHRVDGFLCGDGNGAIGPGGVGDMGSLAFDTYFPFNRPETTFTYYSGHFNFTRDYVGVSGIAYDPFGDPQYQIPAFIGNQFGTNEVIGETVGSFSQYPPVNPADGALEDPDLTNGGPSGMSVDPLSDQLFVCDPGNRRIQVFGAEDREFVRQVGDGSRGNNGSAFVAPSSVAVDFQGNMFVCDVNVLRYIPEKLADRQYGDVGGTVRRLDTELPLPEATISIGNELGTLAIARANINGQYRFEHLRIGTFYMTATKFNHDSDTAVIQIKPDVMVEANFNLNPRTPPTVGSYVGDVIDAETNLYLRGVTVSILGTSLTATTDSLGHFIFTAVAPGTYQVTFTMEGYEPLTRDLIVTSGNTTLDGLIQLTPLGL
jgi:Carboxypeptidase regulatory-like domain